MFILGLGINMFDKIISVIVLVHLTVLLSNDASKLILSKDYFVKYPVFHNIKQHLQKCFFLMSNLANHLMTSMTTQGL